MAKCPYCGKPVVLKAKGPENENQIAKEVYGKIKKEIMYSCPHCNCILGFGSFIGGMLTGRP